MKKIGYLLMMFAIILISVSCEEENVKSIADEGIMTLSELDGQWYFESYLLDDEGNDVLITLDNYEYYLSDYEGIRNAILDWKFDVKNMEATITYAAYPSVYPSTWDFTKTENKLYIEGYVYTIIELNNNKLKLRWDNVPFNFDYTDGILTLTR